MSDRKLLAGFTDGTVDVWDVKGILSETVSLLLHVSLPLSPLLNSEISDYARSHIYGPRFPATESPAEPIARRRPPAVGLGTQRFIVGRSGNRARVQDSS